MIKSIGKLTLATILAAVVLGVPLGASAQTNMAPAAGTATADTKPRPIVFRGKILSVDQVNKTITLDEKTQRKLEVNSETKMMKDGKPATLNEAVVGDDIAGRYTKNPDGTMVANTLRFGAKPVPGAKPAAAAPVPAPAPPK